MHRSTHPDTHAYTAYIHTHTHNIIIERERDK